MRLPNIHYVAIFGVHFILEGIKLNFKLTNMKRDVCRHLIITSHSKTMEFAYFYSMNYKKSSPERNKKKWFDGNEMTQRYIVHAFSALFFYFSIHKA